MGKYDQWCSVEYGGECWAVIAATRKLRWINVDQTEDIPLKKGEERGGR